MRKQYINKTVSVLMLNIIKNAENVPYLVETLDLEITCPEKNKIQIFDIIL